MRTLFTIILLQLLGKQFFKFDVVIQKEALVSDAITSYFFEWKKLISFFEAVAKSFMSFILNFLKLSEFFISANFKSLLISYGPLFIKKGLFINKTFYQN